MNAESELLPLPYDLPSFFESIQSSHFYTPGTMISAYILEDWVFPDIEWGTYFFPERYMAERYGNVRKVEGYVREGEKGGFVLDIV